MPALYEERRIRLHSEGDWAAYREWALRTLWPALEAAGHAPVCVLNGLIGKGVQDVEVIVGYEGYEARQAAQSLFTSGGVSDLVESEEVHLLLSSPYTADRGPHNHEERRAIYGVRRWWIQPGQWDEFVKLSFEGIWPAMDYMGHYVLGFFCQAESSSTGRLECVNLAGYDDGARSSRTAAPFTRRLARIVCP